MAETLTLLLDLCAGKSWALPSPRLFNPLKNFQIKQTNTAFCLETLLAQRLFLSNRAGERKKRHLRKYCVLQAPHPIPSPLCQVAVPCAHTLAEQHSANSRFCSEAAVPHHANEMTKPYVTMAKASLCLSLTGL